MRGIDRFRLPRRTASPSSEGPPPPGDEDAKAADEARDTPERRAGRFLVASLILLFVGFGVLVRVAYFAPSPGRAVDLDGFYSLASANRLQSVKLLDQDSVIVGRYCLAPPQYENRSPGSRPRRCYDPITYRFHASYPASQVATQQLIELVVTRSGADLSVDRQSFKAVAKLLATFVFPLLMLANLFGLIFVTRSGEGSLGEIAGFSRIGKGRRPTSPGVGVSFADVAGAEEAVAELQEVIDYLSDPARFQAYGAAPPKGVLLFGPPGCGKTLLARATAGESGVAFFSASGTEFVESLVGVGAARVRDLFRQVREAAPAILFIDEIDALGRRRSGEGTSGGEREQTLNQLLVELDGFEVSSGVVIMGATNRPDILDPALLRPGRFDRHITMEPPDLLGRRAILELHARGRPLAPDVDFGLLARRTPGFTGADLANVINEAALLAIRQGPGIPIGAAHLSEAVQRVVHGPQRRGRLLSPEERRRLAVHESGHALVAATVGHRGEVHRVSIVARGPGLAQASTLEGDRALLTTDDLLARLTMAVSGVAAEVLVFGNSSTTALDDVSRATTLAREMVGLYGMSVRLGRVRLLGRPEAQPGLDDPPIEMVSGPTMAEFDAEVRRLIEAAEQRATALLRAQRALLDEMAEALQQQETLEGRSLERFLDQMGAEVAAGEGPATAAGNGEVPGGRRPSRRARPRP